MDNDANDQPRMRYDAFISYSHVADDRLAPRLQRAIEQLDKPWYRWRSMHVFRDETDLSATPEGWPAIQAALADSRYFVFLASPRAANSKWVMREVTYWMENRSSSTLLIVLTDGEILWDDGRNDFDWERTKALPKVLAGRFSSEPFWVDLRWAAGKHQLTVRDPQFLKAAAKIAAPVRGLDVGKLISEDYRQHKRTLRIAYGTGAALLVFAAAAIWQYELSQTERSLALVASSYRALYLNPLQAAADAYRASEIKRMPEAEEALGAAIEVAKLRRDNRNEEAQLRGIGPGYLMERWREGGVFTKLRRDGRYLLVASERGQNGSDPPGTVYLISLDTFRTNELPPGAQARGRRLEYMGFSASGEEIFVARQFYLDVFDIHGNRTRSTQLEYHAKPTHLIAGMFGSYVLVGDTVGHLMLADTATSVRPQLKGGQHGDAALFMETNVRGTRSIVLFESGRADLVVLDDPKSPIQREVAKDGIIFAAFSPLPDSTRFLTASILGEIGVWSFDNGELKHLATLNHGRTTVRAATLTDDERRLVSLGDDDSFRLWNAASGALIGSRP
ncbi:TIR domain-containing protein [Aromatoleum diolicum]|uniref:TIR domain-containing protein n=1 Tax=Aromatoleum diolicum TaxID=75796 RepID=A0ABX1QAH9_9RHOO|nr:TIR domain-containing protein [Aromatoleum diolicum]NMG74431.1 TIR domain-containing protein [Aromatoleum diolicum]